MVEDFGHAISLGYEKGFETFTKYKPDHSYTKANGLDLIAGHR
jgi:hypothetical protein